MNRSTDTSNRMLARDSGAPATSGGVSAKPAVTADMDPALLVEKILSLLSQERFKTAQRLAAEAAELCRGAGDGGDGLLRSGPGTARREPAGSHGIDLGRGPETTVLAVVAIVGGLAAWARSSGSTAKPSGYDVVGEDLEPFRAAFNAASEDVRAVRLVGPT